MDIRHSCLMLYKSDREVSEWKEEKDNQISKKNIWLSWIGFYGEIVKFLMYGWMRQGQLVKYISR